MIYEERRKKIREGLADRLVDCCVDVMSLLKENEPDLRERVNTAYSHHVDTILSYLTEQGGVIKLEGLGFSRMDMPIITATVPLGEPK